MIIAALATIYLLGTAAFQERDFFPRFHDEHAYLLQARMLAHGRLWAPQHPLADFFETIHVHVKPVYAPIYFPGAALMHMPGVWLGVPYWITSALLSGCAVGLLYRVTAELIDGAAGVLAALMLLALPLFRQISIMIMSHTNMMLLGLAIVWAYLHWRRGRRTGWLIVIGALSGWAAITRPIDAVAWVAPVGLALLWDLRGQPVTRRAGRLLVIAAAAMPFFALQLAFNLGVTGKPLRTPYGEYLDRFSPQSLWGVGGRATTRPATTLQQKLDYHEDFTVPAMRTHDLRHMPGIWLRERVPQMVQVMLPAAPLLLLLPLGVVAVLRSPPRAVLAAPPVLFVALYGSFAYLLLHYIVVHAPGVIFLVLLGRARLAATWAANRFLACASLLGVIALMLPNFAELNWHVRDDLYIRPVMFDSYVRIPQSVQKPAIVLFRYTTGDLVHEEPVYNVDVVNPDDAPIIRAHDFGELRNRQLFEYYAARQPQRNVYLFDRRTRTLTPLGKVADLVPKPTTKTTTTSPG